MGYLLVLVLLSTSLFGEWADFHQARYLEESAFFEAVAEELRQDKKLMKTIEHASSKSKFFFKREALGVVLKKRPRNNVKEVVAGEIAQLLDSDPALVRSYAMKVGKKEVVLQRLEPLVYGREGRGHPKEVVKRVSLVNYWKGHIQAYLLGLSDLVARNIGVSPDGKLRFFDNETAFKYCHTPTRTKLSFLSGFVAETFDWPHYRKKLDKKSARLLKRYIQSLSRFEAELPLWAAERAFAPPEGLLEALHNIRQFKIREGVTFRDLYGTLFPTLNLGLDKLNRLASSVLHRKVDHGSSLLLATRWIKHRKLDSRDYKDLQKWISAYVEKT